MKLDFEDDMELLPYQPEFKLLTCLPKHYQKIMTSCYHTNNDHSSCTQIDFSYSLDCKQVIPESEHFLNMLFQSIEYVFIDSNMDYNMTVERDVYEYPKYTFAPIIVKLNQQFKNVYCTIRDLNLYVGCDTCDHGTTCSFEICFSSSLESLFRLNLVEQERRHYEYQESWNEIEILKNNCHLTKAEVKIILVPKMKFEFFCDVVFQ